ncbi:hypothetical protein NPIL_533481, partial [Nephila pilipes]
MIADGTAGIKEIKSKALPSEPSWYPQLCGSI